MSRYREISVAEMNPAQKQVHDEIISGKRPSDPVYDSQ